MTTSEPTAPAHRTAGHRLRIRGSGNIAAVLLVLLALFSVLDFQSFASASNLLNIARSAAVFLVMAVGATFVIITAGVDLSVGSVLVFSGVTAGIAMEAAGGQGWSAAAVGVLTAVASGVAWGAVNGLIVSKAKVPPLVTTLGTFGAAQGLALILTDGTDLRSIPPEMVSTVGAGRVLGVPWLLIIAVICALVGGGVLTMTRFGRHTHAIGSNEEAARRAGINVDRHLVTVYAIAGFLAGLAGILSFARFGSTTIAGHATDNLAVIAAVVIGGTSLFGGVGTIFGTVIGVLIPAVLDNGLVIVGLSSFWRDVAVGVVLILAVYFDQVRRNARNQRR